MPNVEITASEIDALMISDRRSLDYVVADVKTNVKKWAYLHDAHMDKPNKAKESLFPTYRPVLEQRASDFEGIMVPTVEQKRDIEMRNNQLKVITVPDTFEETIKLTKKVNRIENHILMVSRLSPEKRPENAIRILAKLRKVNPDATLEFVGYPADKKYQETLTTLVAKERLTDYVTFSGFKQGNELSKAYQSAAVVIQTSQHEGFGLSTVEAFGYGVPVVSYDINYGPRDLIENGINGYLIDNNNIHDFAEKLNAVLTDSDLQAKLREGALNTAKEYTRLNVATQWEDIITELQTVAN